MFRLQLPSDPRWVNLTQISLQDILTDHAYCEQKATSTCISLVQNFSEYEEVVEKVSPIVTEEWGHFRQVLAELKKRGLKLGKQRKDEYVTQLLKRTNKGGSREDQLIEKLLICALIEARSCERFRLLSEELEDDYFKEFYRKFMISEAGHYTLFIELAYSIRDKEKVRERWLEILEIEADIIKNLEVRGDRIH